MADSKITGLGALTAGQVADATDLLVLVDVSDTTMFATGTNKKVTRDALIPQLDVTDGTVAASKAVVLSANKGQDVLTLANAASAASTIATDHTAITAVDDGSSVHLMATKDDNGTETSVKLAEQPDLVNLSSKGAVYSFDGVNDYMNLDALALALNNANNTKGTIVWKGKIHDFTTDTQKIWAFGDANVDEELEMFISPTDYKITCRLYQGASMHWTFTTNNTFSENTEFSIILVQNGIEPKLYINGILESVTFGTSSDRTSWFNVTSGVDRGRLACRNYLNNTNQNFLKCTVSYFDVWNYAWTADEVEDFQFGNIPAKYQWGSQTELMPNQVDRDFSGASAWADVDLVSGSGAYDETGDLTITAGAAGAGDYCTCPVLSVPTTIGKVYRLKYDYTVAVAGAWTIKDFTGVQTIGTISANATQGVLEWTATTTGGLRIVAAANDVSGTFDNFTLTQLGANAAYLPDGFGHYSLMDNSSNALHGTVSGATPLNLNIGAKQTAYLSTTSTTPTMTDVIPGGWKVSSISIETAQNLTVISATQETSSIALIAGKTLNNGKMVWSTMADHMLYASGTPKDIVFALTGNGGVGAKIYVELVRVF